PKPFFEHAILEADGTIAGTKGACKAGMDLSYKGIWGYHPLLVSLANTQEPLFLFNRPASRPSHEGAAGYLDDAADLCRRAGFKKVTRTSGCSVRTQPSSATGPGPVRRTTESWCCARTF